MKKDKPAPPFRICHICHKIITDDDPCVYVKAKGAKTGKWYCRECVRGGHKNDP